MLMFAKMVHAKTSLDLSNASVMTDLSRKTENVKTSTSAPISNGTTAIDMLLVPIPLVVSNANVLLDMKAMAFNAPISMNVMMRVLALRMPFVLTTRVVSNVSALLDSQVTVKLVPILTNVLIWKIIVTKMHLALTPMEVSNVSVDQDMLEMA
jgi:hypothetical protein